jgi:hypothetical protein
MRLLMFLPLSCAAQIHPTLKNLAKGDYLVAHPRTTGVPNSVTAREFPREKPIPDMVQQLLKNLGLPDDKMKRYLDPTRKRQRHASVVGVADPTGAIPEGHVVLTGLPQVESLFVTRFPCIKPSDGRVFPALRHKPNGMSDDDFTELSTLPFGAIIFSSHGIEPMPRLVADGDLDGDYYFVLWQGNLIQAVEAGSRREAARHEKACSKARRRAASRGPNQPKKVAAAPAVGWGWIAGLQSHLRDFEVLREGLDVATAYRHWEEAVTEHAFGSEEALEAGRAYVRSLERGKHGPSAMLPPKPQTLPRTRPPDHTACPPSRPTAALRKNPGLAPSYLRRLGSARLHGIVQSHGLDVNVFTTGNELRNASSLAEDVINALRVLSPPFLSLWCHFAQSTAHCCFHVSSMLTCGLPLVLDKALGGRRGAAVRDEVEKGNDSNGDRVVPDDDDVEASEAFSFCAAATNVVNRSVFLRAMNGKTAR